MESPSLFTALAMASALSVGIVIPPAVRAQSAAQQQQLEYERRQREYWREQERQREAARVQQQQLENARRQQEEINRAAKSLGPRGDTPSGSGAASGGSAPSSTASSRPAPAGRFCKERPLGKTEGNPLIGSWRYRDEPGGDALTHSLGRLAAPGCMQYAAGIEFREREIVTALGTAPALYGRADPDWLVCLPESKAGVLRLRLEGPDQLFDPDNKCRLVRIGGGAPASTAAATASSAAAPAAASAATTVLSFAVAAPGADGTLQPLANTSFYVLKTSADATLARLGFRPLDGSHIKAWALMCQQQTPACQQGLRALLANAAAVAKTDPSGRAHARVPAGTYHVFGVAQNAGTIAWDHEVTLPAAGSTIALEPSNALRIE